MDHVIALRQSSVTALFYLEDGRKIHLRGVRARVFDPKTRSDERPSTRVRERERASFGSSLYMFFPGPVLCKLGQSGVLFVLPEVLTPVLRPSCVLFSRAFLFLIF